MADLNAELQELALNTRRTPERVNAVHLPDQITELRDLLTGVQTLSASARCRWTTVAGFANTMRFRHRGQTPVEPDQSKRSSAESRGYEGAGDASFQ